MAFTLGAWDYVIMAATMIASLAIGIYYRFSGGRQKTNEEYLLADRNMPVVTVAVSLMASFMSAITLLGVSAENYSYGAQFVVINIAYGLSTPIATELYLPVFFGLQKTSTYEYLELRFGPKIRLATSLAYTLQMILYNGIVLYAPSIVLEAVTGLDKTLSILLVGLVCTFYSTIGGMKAVLVTDLLQSMLMYAAVLSVVVFACSQVGGFDQMWEIADQGERLDFNNFSIDPTVRHTWWSLILGGMVTYLSLYAVNHTQVQRLQTVSSLKRSKACLWLQWPILTTLSVTTCLSGLAIYAAYRHCDPHSANKIGANDQLMAYYVMEAMGKIPGLAGLFIAGIFSASLSTISASCNSVAAVTIHDYVMPLWSPRDSVVAVLTKILACCYGLLFLGLAFLAEHLGGVLQAALTIFGAVGGPVFGVFTLGMFTTWANEKGVLSGLMSGLALTLWSSFGGPRPRAQPLQLSTEGCDNSTMTLAASPADSQASDPEHYFYLYRVSYMWTSMMGFLCVLVVGTAVSLLWRQRQPWQREDGSGHPDPALFTPPLAARLRRKQDSLKHGLQVECHLLANKEIMT